MCFPRSGYQHFGDYTGRWNIKGVGAAGGVAGAAVQVAEVRRCGYVDVERGSSIHAFSVLSVCSGAD